MPYNAPEEREARKRRVYDLRNQGLSFRAIVDQLKSEGFPISLHQVQVDLEQARGKSGESDFPFWCFDKTLNFPNCCFNHKIGLPKIKDRVSTLYSYQHDIFKAIEEQKRLAIVKSRRIGATEVILRAILYYSIYGFMKGYQALIVPGTRADLAKRHVRYLRDLLERGGYAELVNDDRSVQDDLYLTNGTEIIAMPSNTPTLRGLPNVIFIFMDEAAFFDTVEQTDILNAVEPSVAVTNGNICAISTPHGKRGFYYSLVSSQNAWHKMYLPYTVTEDKLLSKKYIEGIRKDRTIDFEQEYNCQFSTPENAVYTQNFIDASTGEFELVEFGPEDWRLSGMTKDYTYCVAGIDVALTRDFTSLVVLAKYADRWKPIVCKIYPHITWPIIIEDVKKLYDELKINEIAVDATAMGKAFADLVVGRQMNVEPITFTNEKKTEMINHTKKLFQTQELQLPKKGCPELLLQFSEQQRTDIGGGKVKYTHPPNRHDDLLWSFHLAALKVGERFEQAVVMI